MFYNTSMIFLSPTSSFFNSLLSHPLTLCISSGSSVTGQTSKYLCLALDDGHQFISVINFCLHLNPLWGFENRNPVKYIRKPKVYAGKHANHSAKRTLRVFFLNKIHTFLQLNSCEKCLTLEWKLPEFFVK